jgi:type I restriction-modification system DNA methylase subunit
LALFSRYYSVRNQFQKIMKSPSSYIQRHENYIQRRIAQIHEHITSCQNAAQLIKNIITCFIDEDYNFISFYPGDIEPLNELSSIYKEWDIIQDGDFLGFLYQGLSTSAHKKHKGQFFTPHSIVDYLIQSALSENADIENITMMDPSCGSGHFLIEVYKALMSRYVDMGWKTADAAKNIISKNIFGLDLDPVAADIARHNLFKISGYISANIQTADYIIPEIFTANANLEERTYDLIIGNPPWGATLNNNQKKFIKEMYESSRTGINSFTLFIEKSISLLSHKGTLAFIVPEAYLNIKAHQASRRLVLDSCCIKEIRLLGEQFKKVYAPSIALICTKNSCEQERKRNIVRIIHPLSSETGTALLIPQNYYQSTFQNIFNIHFSKRAETIITKIQENGTSYLLNNAHFFLGIVTGANDHFLSKNRSDHHPDSILIGKDIDKYRISFSGNYFKYSTDSLQQVAPQHLYSAKGKILYKFIGKRLTFAVDNTGYYTLNNVNGFIPKIDNCTPEYLTALLNSPIIQYFYEKNFFTVKVLRNNLEKLPIRILPHLEMKRISKLSETAASTTSTSERDASIDLINDIFFHAYGISEKEAVRMIYGATAEDPGQGFIFTR